jgi:peptidyl-prolyl cis-trans isomerase SurA
MTTMRHYGQLGFGIRQLLAAALLMVAASAGDVFAQSAIVFVNGEPITAMDIDQRSKFVQVTTQKSPSRQEILDQLIDEKLKIREAKRWGMEISDAEVDNNFAGMATRMNQSAAQLTQNLAKMGVNVSTLKTRIKADLAWQQLVRGRYQSRLHTSDREVLSILESKGSQEQENVGYEYVMRPILFLVPPGSPDATFQSRRKEAEALRSRFRGCQESIPMVRAMVGVAVRDQVVRTSADVPDALRKVLDSIPVGQLTAPEVTRHGVELFAICTKRESKSDTPARQKARATVLSERFEQESKRYLRELRKNAMIERGK